MDADTETPKLERELAKYRELVREFPEGPTGETIRDLIEELERQLRALKEKGS